MLKLIKSFKSIALNLVYIDKIVVSDKFKHNHKEFKYVIGYKKDDITRPWWIILYFKIEEDTVFLKYNKIKKKC